MIMDKEAKPQMYSRLASLVLLITLGFFLLFSLLFFFPMSKFSPFLLTIPIGLLSTLFLVTLRKKKGPEDENLLRERMQKDDLRTEIAQKNEQEAESRSDSSFPSDSESSNGSALDEKFELKAQNSSLLSDSESINGSTVGEEGIELDQSSASDNDDDDDDDEEEEEEEEEDGLIEINLPSSHFSGFTEEHDQKLETKLPDFLPEAMFKQEGLMELLAEINEMNEDENLIEIDISMGSYSNTACQDLTLKQETALSRDQHGVRSD